MRRNGLLIGGWALATVLALVLGLQSVSAIADSVTGRPRKTLSPASVRAALDRPVASDDSSSEADASTESRDDSSSSSGSNRSGSSQSSGSAGDDNSSGSSSSEQSSDDESSSDGGDEGSNSSQAFPAPQDETYDSQGGTVTVRFEAGQAHVRLITAHSGFSCEDDSNSSTVDVRCQSISDNHESRIRAFWDNGPQHSIEEKD